MSCGSCHCNPCTCDDVCDPNNEPLASALNNFIASFFGSISKTCVDNQVQWILPCDLNTGLAGFERRQGEGVACYLLRLFEYLNSLSAGIIVQDEGIVIADPASTLNFVGGGVTATSAAGVVTVTIPGDTVCAEFYNKIAINGVCYDTWQAAYDANVGAAVPTLMLVGQGSTFGNLVLTGNYNSNIIPVGFGIPVSQLGTISGAGFTVNITAHQITMGAITSSGAAITLGGQDVIYGAISSANGAGAGGAIVVGAGITTGALTSTGTTSGGAITVGENARIGAINSSGVSGMGGAITVSREVIGTTLLATGANGGAITIGNECALTTITSKPLAAPNGGGVITLGDDCVATALDNSGTVAGTFGGVITIGDRTEVTTITSLGQAGGGALTIGNDCQTTALDCRSAVSGNGGAVTIGRRCIIIGTINCSGINNGGAVSIGDSTFISSTFTGSGAGGTAGPLSVGNAVTFETIILSSAGANGNILTGKFFTCAGIGGTSSGGVVGNTTIGDGSSIIGALTRGGTSTGTITIGNSVTITGDITADCTTGTHGGLTVGNGCNLQGISVQKTIANAGNSGSVTIGSATTCLLIHCGNAGNAASTAGSVILGAGSSAGRIFCHSYTAAAAPAGNVTMEPGASAAFINVSSASGAGGNVTLKNSNILTGDSGLSITMGTSSVGNILSINSKIQDQIDNVSGSSIFRDLIGSTPAANRDFIANLTANGAQFTNALIVPNGTGFSINAGAARTIIAYQLLHKNGLGVNVTLSEGNETTSANLLAP